MESKKDEMIVLELTQDQAELLVEGLQTAIKTQAGAFQFLYGRAKERDASHEPSKDAWEEASRIRQKVNDLDDLTDNILRVLWYNEDRRDY